MNQLEQFCQWLPSTEKLVKAAEENRQAVAVAAGVVSLVGTAHIYRKKKSAPKLHGKPVESLPCPDYLPFLGHSLQFKSNELNAFAESISWNYGEMAQMYIGPMRLVLISSPEAVEKLFRERPNNFKRSFGIEKKFEDSGVAGLFSMEGDDWRHSRAWLFPQFAPGKINKTKGLIIKHAIELRKSLDSFSKNARDINNKWYPEVQQDPSSRYTKTNYYNPDELKDTIDLFSAYAFGVVLDFSFAHDKEECLPENVLDGIKVSFSVMNRRLTQIVPWHKLGFRDADDKKFDDNVANLIKSVKTIIEEYDPIAYREKSDKMSTMLESLWYSLNHQDLDKIESSGLLSASKAASKMSIKHMVGNLLTVISAGYDTTSNTMQAIAYLLAVNPDVQRKFQAEVDAILGSPSARKHMSSDEISDIMEENVFAQFPYANAIINETQRYHPVAPFAGVEAINDTVVDGYVLPKGTNILLLTRVAAMRYCPTPDPFSFKPERWIDATPEQRKQMERLDWSFGGGPRVCPGRHLANLELIYAAVLVFSLYDITEVARPPSAYPVKEGFRFASILENCHLQFTPRV